MPEVELKKPWKLSDLEVGKIFDEIELIIRNDGKAMETLVREHNYLDHGKESEISLRYYDLFIKGGKVKKINYNGYNEFPIDGKNYKELDKKLLRAGL